MHNFMLFILACAIISAASWLFLRMGRSGLTTWVALCGLLANFFVLKQIDLLGFNATASDAFAIGGLFGLNLLQQRYGFAATREAIWVGFCVMIVFVLCTQIHLAYTPSTFDSMHDTYNQLLKPAPRLLAASIFTFLIVQQFDARMFRLAKSMQLAPASILSPLCISISQAIDTILFTILGLVGIIEKPLHIMLVSYSIKLIAIGCLFLTTQLIIHTVKPHEHSSRPV